MKSRSLHCCVVLLSLLLFGCGKKTPLPGPPPHPVHGKVMYQGRPAKSFRVTFYPLKELEKARFAPAAVTDENGGFHLASYRIGDGAPLGEYAVTFSWPKHLNTQQEDGGPEVDQLKGRFADPRKTSFHVTVREGNNELPPFVLE